MVLVQPDNVKAWIAAVCPVFFFICSKGQTIVDVADRGTAVTHLPAITQPFFMVQRNSNDLIIVHQTPPSGSFSLGFGAGFSPSQRIMSSFIAAPLQ
jgi:hypothetical protein